MPTAIVTISAATVDLMHVHFAVHRPDLREMLLGPLALPRAPVQRAEAEVAVGDEEAHAEFVPEA
jgi:hypothetical protein